MGWMREAAAILGKPVPIVSLTTRSGKRMDHREETSSSSSE